MKWLPLFALLLALLGLTASAPAPAPAPAGQITVRTTTRKHVWVRNGNIKVNGNCHNCDIRTTKNTAQVTSTNSRQWTRKF